jgi:acyl dehydratase
LTGPGVIAAILAHVARREAREGLDTRIYKTFTGCGVVNNDRDACRASSGQPLGQLLGQHKRQHKTHIFSLIQKFNLEVDPKNANTQRDDIIVITDDEQTRRVFGDYVSTYGLPARNNSLGAPNCMSKPTWTGTYESLPLGASESCTRLVDGATIDAFANAIQSFNPIHMDGDWTRENTPYPDRIAHGVMTTALMSPVITRFCERWQVRTALVSTSSKYVRPVVAGDTITTTLTLVEKIENRRRFRLKAESKNQRGEVVMVGEAVEQAL